jgi:hypothetical protein
MKHHMLTPPNDAIGEVSAEVHGGSTQIFTSMRVDRQRWRERLEAGEECKN